MGAQLHSKALVAADVCGLVLALVVAEATVGRGDHGRLTVLQELILLIATLPGWLFVAHLYGLYSRDRRHCDYSTSDELVRIFHLVTTGTWILALLFWGTGSANPEFAEDRGVLARGDAACHVFAQRHARRF